MIRHVLRNSLIPIVTLWGLDFGAVIGGGAILTETVFDLQGVGQYAAESIGQLDVPPVLAVTMFGAFFIVLLNTIVDIVYAVPRSADPPPVTATASRCSRSDDLRGLLRDRGGARCEAVDGVSLRPRRRARCSAVVGESGSGKSVTAMTLIGLTRSPNARFEGTATYKGTELIGATDDELRRMRGAEIAMIFQDPMTSLNPVQRIGDQIVEQIQAHEDAADAAGARARDRAARARRASRGRASGVDVLPARVLRRHAPARDDRAGAVVRPERPDRRRADHRARRDDPGPDPRAHPRAARRDAARRVILVTHDLGVVADIADRIAVMYAGRIVEQGTLDEIFYDPQHPYTWGLLGSIARVDRPRPDRLPAIAGHAAVAGRPAPRAATSARAARTSSTSARRCRRSRRAGGQRPSTWTAAGSAPRRSASCARCDPARSGSTRRGAEEEGPSVDDRRDRRRRTARPAARGRAPQALLPDQGRASSFEREVARVHAVDDVTLRASHEGETLGLVGESGCGKTTLSRAIMRLIDSTDGHDPLPAARTSTTAGRTAAASRCAAQMQMVFQDPFASLNPRKRVRPDRRRAAAPPRHAARRGRAAGAASCSSGSASRPSTSTATRTSSPAASASGSAWPARWRSSRG